MRKGRPQYYAVYLRGTDTVIASGSAEECMEQMHMSQSSFHATMSRIRSGVNKKYELYQEDLDDDECDY